jgi:hypothetical protein
MTEEELKTMQKDLARAKRIAIEKAGELHDLVEERLPSAYEELPIVAQATYEACRAWAETEAACRAAATNSVNPG